MFASRVFPPRLVAMALALGLLGLSMLVAAGQSRIELRDGSVLTGELIAIEPGGYRIRTPVLGELVLNESQVLAIRPAGGGGVGTPVPTSGGAGGTDSDEVPKVDEVSPDVLANLQRRMIGDAEILSSIQSLQEDPELQAALADPAFTQAVLSGDLATLQQDPRFMNLVEHPVVQAIIGRVTGE